MYISDEAWTKYIDRLRRVNEKAAQEMFHYLTTHEWWKNKQEKKAALDVAAALSTKYGEASSELACEYYDFVMDEAMRNIDRTWSRSNNRRSTQPAEPAAPPTYGEVAKAFYGAAKNGNENMMAQTVGRLVKQAGADTILKNALRDGAQFAWVPHGDTCPFCIMLASRGWQYASKKTIQGGHAEHIHANCDCTFAVRFDDRTNVEGYDPDLYKRMYYDAGDTPKERLNTMRRIHYAENKDYINAQKRAAYAWRNNNISLMQADIIMDIPDKMIDNFDDFDILSLRVEEEMALKTLREMADRDNYEYGIAIVDGEATEPFTDKLYDKVSIPENIMMRANVNLYHSHTNSSLLSAKDFELLTYENINTVAVSTKQGSIFKVSIGYGYRPDKMEFRQALEDIRNMANENVMADPDFFKWSIEQRNYMAIREQAVLIARRFGWRLEGGYI